MDRAALQEQELRRAENELTERKMQERAMAQELAEKESSKMAIEEKYKSLEEEAEAKTKKLQKLWTKYQVGRRCQHACMCLRTACSIHTERRRADTQSRAQTAAGSHR